MNHLILTLLFSLFLNLLCFNHSDLEPNNVYQIGIMSFDADTSDCSDDNLPIQELPTLVYGTRLLSITSNKLKETYQTLFNTDHPVRGPPQIFFSV